MTTLQNPRSTIKTRDLLKYMFAGFLAAMTVVAIGGLMLAKHHRQKTTAQEELQIKQAISVYGKDGALPAKIELPQATPAGGTLSE
jgi:L,D-peptidoglycan transpeptidase YkuD (ErfK/YbiS/YcfS/YnhG family)